MALARAPFAEGLGSAHSQAGASCASIPGSNLFNLETAAGAELIEIVEMQSTAPHSLNLAETI